MKLLAPLQDWRSVPALRGADEVYFGIGKLNMRAEAVNFSLGDLPKLVKKIDAKTNLTTNIIYYDNELKQLEKIIIAAKKAGINAVIVHEPAAIKLAKKHGMEFHISTQASVSNLEAAKFYQDMGASRINFARELSLKQIAYISKKLKIETEVFCHGAMCMAISGRCFLSLDNFKTSANRGNCLQPCRRAWKLTNEEGKLIYDGRFFSAKDLCMIEFIPELAKAGIDVLKIEGRMKNPYYIETVTSAYSHALQEFSRGIYTKTKARKYKQELAKAFNRGFSTGFYFTKSSMKDIQPKDGSQATKQLECIGKVLSFRQGKAKLQLKDAKPSEIVISGKSTYQRMQLKTPVKQGTIFVKVQKARKGDLVYVISTKSQLTPDVT
jgi:putative protease